MLRTNKYSSASCSCIVFDDVLDAGSADLESYYEKRLRSVKGLLELHVQYEAMHEQKIYHWGSQCGVFFRYCAPWVG